MPMAPTRSDPAELPEGKLSSSILEALAWKLVLIKKTVRPPNFETPVYYFNEVFTPNSALYAEREWRRTALSRPPSAPKSRP